jgi:hypothetical protein
MKLNPSKFALALGLALSISFLFCNIIFTIGGNEFSLRIVNTLFHNMDLKPLIIEHGFDNLKLISGMVILFLEGFFTGYITAAIYNTLNKTAVQRIQK